MPVEDINADIQRSLGRIEQKVDDLAGLKSRVAVLETFHWTITGVVGAFTLTLGVMASSIAKLFHS